MSREKLASLQKQYNVHKIRGFYMLEENLGRTAVRPRSNSEMLLEFPAIFPVYLLMVILRISLVSLLSKTMK